MSEANTRDRLEKACAAGEEWACELLGEKNMAGFKDGGLLADASRTWRMESDYPEFEKGIADRLSKERVPEAEIEEQFNYSPLQRGYAEGGEVDFDAAGSMLSPEVPLNFEDEVLMEDEMMMDEEEDTMGGLSPEDEEILFQALSDYPELEEILNKLGAIMSPSMDVFDEEGSVEGPGTGTSDSIPANLSDGEFVFTAKAVKQLGVDKLRKMMAKAEEDYDDGDAEQMIAQMGDEGFAAGGLLTKPKYGSYAGGGRVYEDIPVQGLFEDRLFEGREFSLGQIISMSRKKRFGENFLSKVSRIGNTNKYRVKGMAEGGAVSNFDRKIEDDYIRGKSINSISDSDSNYPLGVMDKKGYDKMINQHYDEWSPSDGIPGEGNPHIGEKVIRRKGKGLGTILYKLLGLDPVTFIKGRDGKPAVGRESSLFTET